MDENLKIAIMTPDSLPDARVERSILLHMDIFPNNNNLYLVGEGSPTIINKIIDTLSLPYSYKFIRSNRWPLYVKLFGITSFFRHFRKRIKKILTSIKPDVVYAHNIFAAKLICNLGYDFIFDDHELISLNIYKRLKDPSIIDRYRAKITSRIWFEWEKEIVEKALSIITVSENIKKYYTEKYCISNVYVIPNVPHSLEIKTANRISIPSNLAKIVREYKKGKLALSYIGRDIFPRIPFFGDAMRAEHIFKDIVPLIRPYRDLTYIKNVLKPLRDKVSLFILGTSHIGPMMDNHIIGLGHVHHLKMYKLLQDMHVGLAAWRPHPLHKYFSPNKVFIYMHSGLLPLLTDSMIEMKRHIGHHAVYVKDPEREISEILNKLYYKIPYIEETKEERKKFAVNKLILDNYKCILRGIYKKV